MIAPVLPASITTNYCYNNMFSQCRKLKYVEVNFKNWQSPHTDFGIPSNTKGYFVCPVELPAVQQNIPAEWEIIRKSKLKA